jgi:hypothetical protein
MSSYGLAFANQEVFSPYADGFVDYQRPDFNEWVFLHTGLCQTQRYEMDVWAPGQYNESAASCAVVPPALYAR